MSKTLSFMAGPRALGIIRDEGLNPDRVSVMAGAAGGPKWLILGGMDRFLAGEFFRDRKKPLYLVGSSIGTWRFAAMAQKKPVEAIDAFEKAYLKQSYSRVPTTDEVTGESLSILDDYLPDSRISQILNHPFYRLNILAVKSRHILAVESRPAIAAGMAAATLTNIISRRSMGLHFERTLFYDRRDIAPFHDLKGFPIHRVELTHDNLKPAIMASGSIPMVMKGVTGIPGAPEGTYRDGGMIDYHPDIPFDPDPEHIVLYPHYTGSIIPGWLDKHVPWHRAQRKHLDNVLIVCPSKDFIAGLPYGKVPDRNDFMKFKGRDNERLGYWRKAIEGGKILGEELCDAVASGKIRSIVSEY
ncbi:MAG TPA: patatin-like phospholipase family protein [Spirochaetota bacterium]|nr:patatin-like phospholipase family protein [Spirochaetota bacterium]HPC41859.1 patatin-like phospholipase family protein [Spirochaetota bacterium]HQF07580.1 patatin-like phospholipase family protein [Spirochaetota bacterium]HQH96311.1 patatin-like phospholipase family protein [Spirochaetota bacterium]HQJ69485.1 patatin-like phospholipase family protein [Spirochaetota bacterium]